MSLIGSIFFSRSTYLGFAISIVMFILAQYFNFLYPIAMVFFFAFIAVFFFDLLLLYRFKNGVNSRRISPEKLSNGDENQIIIEIENEFPYQLNFELIDEIPAQFQKRDFKATGKLNSRSTKTIHYTVRPTQRGEYTFGSINIFTYSKFNFVKRKFIFNQEEKLPVYPSFLSMRQYSLLAMSNRLSDIGIKKIRRVGHSMEFEHIRQYVSGDDYRSINWKATARKNELMVNQYQDEKSQEVYSIIDMGRNMKMPFDNLTLLDYSINASLVISNIANQKGDKAGLVTFSTEVDSFLKADKRKHQIKKIQEILYKQNTRFLEPNFETLVYSLKRNIKHRSLFILYTNFETLNNFKRYLEHFKTLASSHLLVIVFFKNTEFDEVLQYNAETKAEIYHKAVVEGLLLEKHEIVKELDRYGILSVFTRPENLNVNVLNKYLEIKQRNMI